MLWAENRSFIRAFETDGLHATPWRTRYQNAKKFGQDPIHMTKVRGPLIVFCSFCKSWKLQRGTQAPKTSFFFLRRKIIVVTSSLHSRRHTWLAVGNYCFSIFNCGNLCCLMSKTARKVKWIKSLRLFSFEPMLRTQSD